MLSIFLSCFAVPLIQCPGIDSRLKLQTIFSRIQCHSYSTNLEYLKISKYGLLVPSEGSGHPISFDQTPPEIPLRQPVEVLLNLLQYPATKRSTFIKRQFRKPQPLPSYRS